MPFLYELFFWVLLELGAYLLIDKSIHSLDRFWILKNRIMICSSNRCNYFFRWYFFKKFCSMRIGNYGIIFCNKNKCFTSIIRNILNRIECMFQEKWYRKVWVICLSKRLHRIVWCYQYQFLNILFYCKIGCNPCTKTSPDKSSIFSCDHTRSNKGIIEKDCIMKKILFCWFSFAFSISSIIDCNKISREDSMLKNSCNIFRISSKIKNSHATSGYFLISW